MDERISTKEHHTTIVIIGIVYAFLGTTYPVTTLSFLREFALKLLENGMVITFALFIELIYNDFKNRKRP